MDQAPDSGSTSEGVRRLAGALIDDDALENLLQKVVLLACHTVGAAHSVSITVAEDNGAFRTCNSTEDEAFAIDQAQYAGNGGPCLEAIRSAAQVQIAIGADEPRWPLFEAKAKAEAVTAVLSTPLRTIPGTAIGALNIYAHEGEFDDDARRTAELIGEHASILVGKTLALHSAAQLNEQLRQALASREIIGEAKGVIMERQSCTRDEAFDILRRASQRENRKLRDLAEELVLRVEARKREGRAGE